MVDLHANARNSTWRETAFENSRVFSAGLGQTMCHEISIRQPVLWLPTVRKPVFGCFSSDCRAVLAPHPGPQPSVHVPDGDGPISLLTFSTAIMGVAFWFRQRRVTE